MESNRYAPPKADLDGVRSDTGPAPALWNPTAAANWSLLFSPVFGAWVQMKNWTTLGETRRAAAAKGWLIASAVLILGLTFAGILMPRSAIAERFGADYPRRGWGQPLLWGLGAYAAVIAVAAMASRV